MRARACTLWLGLAVLPLAAIGQEDPGRPSSHDPSLFAGSSFPGSDLLRVNSYDTLLAQLSVGDKSASVAYAPFLTDYPYSPFKSELRLLLGQAEKVSTVGVSWTHNPASPLGKKAAAQWDSIWRSAKATYPPAHGTLLERRDQLVLEIDGRLAVYVPTIPDDRAAMERADFDREQRPGDEALAKIFKEAQARLTVNREKAEAIRRARVAELVKKVTDEKDPTTQMVYLKELASEATGFESLRSELAGATAKLAEMDAAAAESAGSLYTDFRRALLGITTPTITVTADSSFFELLGGSEQDADADGLDDNRHAMRSRSLSVGADWRPRERLQISALAARVEKRETAEEGMPLVPFDQASLTIGYRLRILNSKYESTPEFKESLFVPMMVGGLSATHEDCRDATARCPKLVSSSWSVTAFLDFKLKKEAQFRIGPKLTRQSVGGKDSSESLSVVSALTVSLGAPK